MQFKKKLQHFWCKTRKLFLLNYYKAWIIIRACLLGRNLQLAKYENFSVLVQRETLQKRTLQLMLAVEKKENAYCRVQLANFKQLQIA